MTYLGVAAAGAVGAVARYVLHALVHDRVGGVFPWGSFLINVSGSLLLGLIAGFALYHGLSDTPKAVLGSGFCGGFTTFSTFAYDTVGLAEEGAHTTALVNVVASTAAALVAAGVGLAVAGVL